MGYIINDIAVITDPKIISLSGSANFVQFASKPHTNTTNRHEIKVLSTGGSNLMNPATVTVNTRVNHETGEIRSASFTSSTDYMPVVPGLTYVGRKSGAFPIASFTYTAWYDVDKVFISGISNFGNTQVAPPGAYFVRTSLNQTSPTAIANQGFFEGADATWEAYSGGSVEDVTLASRLEFKQTDDTLHVFNGTNDQSKVGGNVYLVTSSAPATAQNLMDVLLKNDWLRANFNISIPLILDGATLKPGDKVVIVSKGAGTDYDYVLTAPNDAGGGFYTITAVRPTSTNNDTLLVGQAATEIRLDVYTDPDVVLGGDDQPTTDAKMGDWATAPVKTYSGAPLWFELNAMFGQYPPFNLPPGVPGWFPTGTSRKFRFAAKVSGAATTPFYYSNTLFVLNGYGQASETIDFAPYTYTRDQEATLIKLLTNAPKTFYTRGQRAYINFLFERDAGAPFSLRAGVAAYDSTGALLGTVFSEVVARADIQLVNSFELDLEAVLDEYPTATQLRAAVYRTETQVSEALVYDVRPECLHELNDFAFLNRLGGWDDFNMDAGTVDEIKPSRETFNKTQKPGFKKGDSLETVYKADLKNTFTVEGAPVNDATATWLKEFAASRVILNKDGFYVIVEDFTLRVSPTDSNFHTPILKYKLSETYSNG